MGAKFNVGFFVGILVGEIIFIILGISLYVFGRKDFIGSFGSFDFGFSRL